MKTIGLSGVLVLAMTLGASSAWSEEGHESE